MKIKLLTGIASPTFSHSPGEVVEFPESDAAGLIEAGFAERFEEDAAFETASMEPVAEHAAIEKKKGKR